MLAPFESEPFRTYALIVLGSTTGVSHAIIMFLRITGLLLRPFWQQPVALLYPWVYMWGDPPRDLARTPFRPSKLLLIHTLWFTSSVGLWVGLSLIMLGLTFAYLFPGISGIERHRSDGTEVGLPFGLLLVMWFVIFAVWSSRMWLDSLRRSLAHFRHMKEGGNDGGCDGAEHHLAPFRKSTKWAFATLPIYIGWAALALLVILIHPQ